jgi:glycosyltransferase involved in cell wall biosynthesis
VDALNTGLAESRARFVARMDVDDLCEPDRLSLQYEMLRRNDDICLVSCLVEPMHENRLSPGMGEYLHWVNQSVTHDQIIRDLFIESPLPHPSVMFRKESVLRAGGYRDYDGPEDYDLWLRLALEGGRFAKVPKPLLIWRIHAGSFSRTDSRYRADAFIRRKFEYLMVWLNRRKPGAGKRFKICGAGKLGRRLQRFLSAGGIDVEAFVDTNPNRIGDRTLALPVLSPDSVQMGEDGHYYFGAVGTWSGRKELQNFFERMSKERYRDYVIL